MSDVWSWLKVYLKGVAMGAADAVPGVSGGTIALITGIYSRLINSLSSPDAEKFMQGVNHLKRFDLEEIISMLLEMDVPFLIVLGTGIASSVIFVLNVVHILLENFTVTTYSFFIGLIAASAVILYREVDLSEGYSKLAALLGFLFAFIVSGIGATSLGHGPFVVFFSGAVAVSAMILPGISGSLILVILGQYDYMSQAVSKASESLLGFFETGDMASFIESVVPVVIFLGGAVTGVLSLVKVVDYALNRSKQVTMAFLVSLMAGALRAPYLQIEKVLIEEEIAWLEIVPEFSGAVILGAIAIVLLDRNTSEL